MNKFTSHIATIHASFIAAFALAGTDKFSEFDAIGNKLNDLAKSATDKEIKTLYFDAIEGLAPLSTVLFAHNKDGLKEYIDNLIRNDPDLLASVTIEKLMSGDMNGLNKLLSY